MVHIDLAGIGDDLSSVGARPLACGDPALFVVGVDHRNLRISDENLLTGVLTVSGAVGVHPMFPELPVVLQRLWGCLGCGTYGCGVFGKCGIKGGRAGKGAHEQYGSPAVHLVNCTPDRGKTSEMRIFLVRHGMSRSNVDWSENRRVADHAIELTEEGKKQARGAGKALAKYFEDNLVNYAIDGFLGPIRMQVPNIRLWNSPYLRTRQTRDELMSTCVLRDLSKASKDTGTDAHWERVQKGLFDLQETTYPKPGDSWFRDQREHFLLHEQQFGIFDGLSDDERRNQYPAEAKHYEKCKKFEGKVWAKLPMGESRMDVARRMHQAFGTFKRDAEKHGIQNIVVVGHGTTNRAFTMAWMHHSPEWFETEPNPKNCSIRLIENGEDMGYIFKGYDHPEGFTHNQVPNPESEE